MIKCFHMVLLKKLTVFEAKDCLNLCITVVTEKTASTASTAFLDPTVRVENRFGQSCEMLCPDRLAFDRSLGQTIGPDALTYCLQFLPFCKAGNRKSKRQSSVCLTSEPRGELLCKRTPSFAKIENRCDTAPLQVLA